MTDDVAGGEAGVEDVPSGTAEADDAYSGLFGAFPYAFRSSDSLAFKSYAIVGGLLALAVTFLFGLSIVVLIGATTGGGDGTFSFSRAFFVLVGLLVVAPILAPILFVARRHRRGTASSSYDGRMAAAGYLFVFSVYLALVISAPEAQQAPATGTFAPLVEFLYALPSLVGLIPPLLGALLIWFVGRSV